MFFATIHMKAFKNAFRNEELMTKEQMENIIQENMQKIYLYCVKRLEVSSKKAELFKMWFAQMGKERIERVWN